MYIIMNVKGVGLLGPCTETTVIYCAYVHYNITPFEISSGTFFERSLWNYPCIFNNKTITTYFLIQFTL
jgi:hypothetical protein